MEVLSRILNGLFGPHIEYTELKGRPRRYCPRRRERPGMGEEFRRKERNALGQGKNRPTTQTEDKSAGEEEDEGFYCPSCNRVVAVKEVRGRILGKREVYKYICTCCGRILRYSLMPSGRGEAEKAGTYYARRGALFRRKNGYGVV